MIDFSLEPLSTARPDIEQMIPAQWLHTGDSEVDLRPNWNFYHQLDQCGAMLLVIAREDGRPVGYMFAAVYPHPNAIQEIIANISTYYVEARAGRGHILNSMTDYLLDLLALRGAFRVDIETNAEFSAGRLWELKGFKVAKIGYSLKLKKPAGVKHA